MDEIGEINRPPAAAFGGLPRCVSFAYGCAPSSLRLPLTALAVAAGGAGHKVNLWPFALAARSSTPLHRYALSCRLHLLAGARAAGHAIASLRQSKRFALSHPLCLRLKKQLKKESF
jgi:hypothetical protein